LVVGVVIDDRREGILKVIGWEELVDEVVVRFDPVAHVVELIAAEEAVSDVDVFHAVAYVDV
jgi:hypothetical protein